MNALIQTVSEGAEEILSQVGGNTVDYATGVTDEFKPLEGVQDAFVYGAAGGAQFGGVTSGAAGYRAAEMHDLNQKIKRSDTDAGKYVENWQGWKEQLNSMFAGERAQALKDIEANPELSEEGKKAAKQYIAASSMRDAKRNELKEQHKLNLEQSAELGKMIYASRQDKQSASLTNLYTEKQKLEAELGEITTLPFEMVEQSEESTPEIIEAKRQYDLVNAQYESVMASLKEEIDAFTAPQVQALQEVAREDGSITELNIGTEENAEMVYLVAGEIATTEDGVIDPSATSPILTVRDSQGRKRMIGRGRVTRVHTDQLEAAKEAIKGQAYDTYLTPLISKLEGKTDYSQG